MTSFRDLFVIDDKIWEKEENMPNIENNQNSFNEVLSLIQKSKRQVYKQANIILMELYWNVGHYISDKTTNEGWGKSTVKELAEYIQKTDPSIGGFSVRNIWRMKQFYETYKENKKLSPLVTQVSWTNNLIIMSGRKSDIEKEFYLRETIKNNYSKRELERQIYSSSFERTLLGNEKLSPVVRELPQNTKDIFKDTYVLELLGLPKKHKEKDLQSAIVSSLKEFILELGVGFAFIGQEYRVSVGDEDFYIDLLFSHRYLQCLVAFELKIDKFKPSHLGQLEFYLEALDRDVKAPHENPSIGVLLCKEKDDEVVKYALNRCQSPTVIADYETELIPKELLKRKVEELYRLYEGER
jgi:predicted nuclease of restriction endonuclease-like (RecB) superfamily